MITKSWLLAGLMLILAGCGGSSSTSSSAYSSSSGSASQGIVSSVSTINSKYGKILASTSGYVYYMFEPDTSKTSACYGACAITWPPVTVAGSANPAVSGGANKSLVGTITRTGGTKQVTYGGHPLYTFKGDSGPDQTNGQGINHFGGYWYVMGADGQPVTSVAASSTPGTTQVTTAPY
ncbi:MAG: hypothetical protein HKL84_07855 [Acidimicrobiaceae bacterium]|nr:hypothetical protein [Acidimicrobiaceae bacterium]